jgi:hypothetical protein
MKRKKPFSIYLLSIVLVFLSISALICGAAMMYDPSGKGMQLSLDVLKSSPFNNFFIPGFFLFTCLGVLPLVALYALVTTKQPGSFATLNIYSGYRVGWMLSLFSGFGTLIWITTQQHFTQTFHWLQTFYMAVGMLVLILSLLPSTMNYCRSENFKV